MSKRNGTISHIGDLTPDPENRRQHNPRNIGMVVDALHEVGAARSIVIDEAGVVLAGNGVIEAAAEAGIERVQVVDADGETIVAVRRSGLTEEQKRRLALFDNRAAELAEWDLEQLQADLEAGLSFEGLFSGGELEALLAEVSGAPSGLLPDADPDAIPEAVETRAKPGDLWLCGEHRLLVGDSTNPQDVERLMAGERADCVFTSPPYAVGVDYGHYADTIENLREMLPGLAALWMDAVVDGGFAVVNFGDIAPGRDISGASEPCEYPMAVEYWPVFRAAGWLLWSRRVWCKPNARVNSMWCIQSNRAATDWEHVWTWKKPGKAILERVGGTSQMGWFDSTSLEGVDVGKETHGAGMPVGVAARMLEVHSRPGAVVSEPFSGTGTTMIACEKLGRRCFGMEQAPNFADIAIARFESLTAQQPRRVE